MQKEIQELSEKPKAKQFAYRTENHWKIYKPRGSSLLMTKEIMKNIFQKAKYMSKWQKQGQLWKKETWLKLSNS